MHGFQGLRGLRDRDVIQREQFVAGSNTSGFSR
jgi:hypothetical protein